jgi:Rad3-related DNA helicase
MKGLDILNSFYGKAKEHQIKIIKELETALKMDYKNIILCAPTGTGKSYIAMALALAYSSSSILTGTIDLQEQYLRDFPFVKTIKGKRHFNCIKISNRKIRCDTISSSLCYNKRDGFCKYYPRLNEFSKEGYNKDERIVYYGDKDELCEYYKQKFEALLASHTIFNYHEYMALLKFTHQAPKREIMVCDEAHLLENRLVEFYGLNINNRLLSIVGLNFPTNRLYEIETWQEFLMQLIDEYVRSINAMEDKLERANNIEFLSLNEELSKLESNLERLEFIYDEVKSEPSNYVVTIERDNNVIKNVILLPIEISKYTIDLFNMSNIRLFMSATIDYDIFTRSIGLKRDDTYFINADSPFPINNRKVYFCNKYTLNKENMSNKENIIKIAMSIDEIMNKHSNEHGLILLTSYALAFSIRDNLSINNKNRLIITNDIRREEIIKELTKSKNSVIISPSLWEGIDLKDDLCRFIIIAKAPYLDLNDKRIAVKMRKDMEWYIMQSAMRLIQGCGRGVRHDNDYCTTYILDKNATILIRRAENRIPEWFKKACIYL